MNDSDDENADQKKTTTTTAAKTQDKKASTSAATEQKKEVESTQRGENRRQDNQRPNNNSRGDNNNGNNQGNRQQNNYRGDGNRQYNNNRGNRGVPAEGNNNTQEGEQKREYKPRFHKDRDERKQKGVPSEPHPQDRHSGTGQPAFQKNEFRKGGGGRGNYGTIKDELIGREELKNTEQQQQQQPHEQAKQEEPAVVEEKEVVDNTMTLAEYYNKLGVTGAEEKKPEPVQRQLNEEELKKEKLQLVHSRNEKQLDSQVVKAHQKVKKGNTSYQVGCNSEHSDLLGVKTGSTLVQYTVKKDGENIVGEVKKEARRENTAGKEQRGNQNRKPKVDVENENDFPKLA